MNRRAFLTRLLSGAAGLALGAELDVERLLWVPKPIITVPAVDAFTAMRTGIWEQAAQDLRTPDWLAREAFRLFDQQLGISKRMIRYYDVEGARVGDTLNVRLR